jgi:hypothetical protein
MWLSVGIYASPIGSTYSDDFGRTWSPIQLVSSPACIGAQPVFLTDGALAMIYWSFLNESATLFENRIEVALSSDGGETFGIPRWSPVHHRTMIRLRGTGLLRLSNDARGNPLCRAPGQEPQHAEYLFTRSIDRGK